MKYVDENAWNALLAAIRNGTLVNSDDVARGQAVDALPLLAEIPTSEESTLILNSLEGKITTLQAQLADASDVEAYLANLSYFFHLAGKAWETAYERVSEVASTESAAKFLMFLPARLFLFALKTSISALTAGGASVIGTVLIQPLAEGLHDTVAEELIGEGSKDAMKNLADTAPNFAFDSLASTTNAGMNAMVNPAKVFAQYEGHLRKIAVEIREKRRNISFKAPQVHKNMVDNLKELFPAGSELEALVLKPTDGDDMTEKWSKILNFLQATMRRVAWTQYCRANWDNATWDYTITVQAPAKLHALVGNEPDPRKWPAKSWDSVKGWPEYWYKICGDFIGPEHLPSHPMHGGKKDPELQPIKDAAARQAWISMAAVHCCQIKNPNISNLVKSVKFDLLKYNGDKMAGNQEYVTVATELVTATAWNDEYKPYLSKKPVACRIVNAFFSSKSDVFFTPTGKKGRIDSPSSPSESLLAPSGYASGVVAVGIRGATMMTTNTVTLNVVHLPVTDAEARTVTGEFSGAQPYQFFTNVDKVKKEILVADAKTKKQMPPPVKKLSTGFKTGASQSIKFNLGPPGLYCMWLTTTASDFPVSDELWYVWVVAAPK